MRPFSAAVANDLFQMMGEALMRQPQSDPRPTVYVHTLIADKRGLKELERQLAIIRMSEETRGANV